MIKKFFYFFLAVLLSSHISLATEAAKSFIEDLGRRAIDSLTKPGASSTQLESNFQDLLEEGFDVHAIGKFVMSRHWEKMSPEQKDRFISLFESRLKKSYANRFQEYRGVDFKVKDARQEGDSIIVSSTIQKPGGPLTPVEWRVQGGKIHDVTVEGISMSYTIRQEYNALVRSNGDNIENFLNILSGAADGDIKTKPPSSDDGG